MEHYLYKSYIFKNPEHINGADIILESSNRDDFLLNYQSLILMIENIELRSNTFIIELSYTDFKEKINSSNISWTTIGCQDDGWKYILYVISEIIL